MIRVILAEDHNVVRQGIRSLLEKASDIEIVAEAENGQEAFMLVQRLKPEVLVMDITMPRLNGIQAAEQIRALGLTTQVIILSMHSDETLVRQALRIGVRGYLLKGCVADDLIQAIRDVAQGKPALSPAIMDLVMHDFVNGLRDRAEDDLLDRLSAREREILQLIAEGRSNKTIAEMIHVSTRTVEKHRANLMTKLNVQDLAGLMRIAFKYGLILVDQ